MTTQDTDIANIALTEEQAAGLVNRILTLSPDDAHDGAARALLAIIHHLAYQDEWAERDAAATLLERAIYPLTAHADKASTAFLETAQQLLASIAAQPSSATVH